MIETNSHVALFHHPDAVETSRTNLMGRHAAGEGFLRGFVRHASSETFLCHAIRQEHFLDFQNRVGALDNRNRPCQWIPVERSEGLAEPGCLYVPGPALAGFAWRRRSIGARRYSICGVNHTIASENIMDGLGALLTSPVQPWDAVICTSHAVKAAVSRVLDDWADYLSQRTGGRMRAELQLPVVPLGVDCDRYAAGVAATTARHDLRKRFSIGEDDIVLLFMGRLSFHAKAHPLPMYLAAETAAQKTGKKIHLIQAGWFAHPKIKEQFVESAKLYCPSVNMVFADGRDEAIRNGIWFAADVFLSLSDNIQETFGLTPIEAMAAGLPVIVSDWDGYRDTVRHGTDGFCVPTAMPGPGDGAPFTLMTGQEFSSKDKDEAYNVYCGRVSQCTSVDVAATTEALCALVGNPELRARMGQAGRRRARDGFDWRVVVAAYEALWAELADIRAHTREVAPLRPGMPPHPLRNEPFSAFESYPSFTIAGSRAVQHVPGTTGADVDKHMALSMNAIAAASLLSREQLRSLVDKLAEAGTAHVHDMARWLDGMVDDRLTRSVAWLAKMGLVHLVGTTRNGAEPREGGLRARAAEARKAGNVGEAIRILQMAVVRSPDDPDLNASFGDALLAVQRDSEAIPFLRAAVRGNPAMVEAQNNLGFAFLRSGDTGRAIESFKRAIKLSPAQSLIWYRLGVAYWREGRVNDAEPCLERAIALGGVASWGHYHLGLVRKAIGKKTSAMAAFEEAVRRDSHNVFAEAARLSLRAAMALPKGLGSGRVGIHMSHRFHFRVLRPLFEALSEKFETLFTSDAYELAEFKPDVVVVMDIQADSLRRLLPNAIYVAVRHDGPGRDTLGRIIAGVDYCCISGKATRQRLTKSKDIAKEKLWSVGTLHADTVINGGDAPLPFAVREGCKTVLFVPSVVPQVSAAPVLGDRLASLIRGERKDVDIIIKPHPRIFDVAPQWIVQWRKLADVDAGIHLIDDPTADVSAFLNGADVLITDVSGAAFTFLLLDRPILFVTNPAAKESSHYDETAPEWAWREVGEEVKLPERLAVAVDRALDHPRWREQKRAEYRERIFGNHADGKTVERIVKKIGSLLTR